MQDSARLLVTMLTECNPRGWHNTKHAKSHINWCLWETVQKSTRRMNAGTRDVKRLGRPGVRVTKLREIGPTRPTNSFNLNLFVCVIDICHSCPTYINLSRQFNQIMTFHSREILVSYNCILISTFGKQLQNQYTG